ncbi:hypothetical protein TSAR_012112 [Trichomalopsis sarcophagae]|uniref:Uncharacterized protein n=1 Tax=Trichomalopsis sarcophagae TaxID=543379 RepID=A0A232F7Z8_9HYME|nr:hypothetical protein TSAR_012112 [Trichomalopsis sarcophagae]
MKTVLLQPIYCMLNFLKFDVLWMMSHFLKITTPMWVGFNSKILKDHSKQQKVSYLTPINKSPTDKSVVIETMRRAIAISNQLTYDLGIAQIAMIIQSEEKEEFQNPFIHLVGTFIDGCGLTTILIEAELLGSGSEASFINGKIYTRCKKLHVLAVISLKILEFEFFLDQKNITLDDEMKQYFNTLQNSELDGMKIENSNVNHLIKQFLEFHKEVMLGYYGKTAQFYAQYITLIKYYLIFDLSIRMSNFELYKHIIPKISNKLCPFARWLTFYDDKLLNIDKSHPGLKNQLLIGVKRTDKRFSRVPVNLTLEQTVNAECGRRLTGISHLNLLKNRIEQSKRHIQKFIVTLKNRMNPFSYDHSKDMLLNISTGEADPAEIANFLHNIEKIGEDKRKKFIDCSENENNFSKYKIKHTKILNFEMMSKKEKINVAGKVQEVKLQPDLFGRLLAISLEQDIDLDKILTYPLTPFRWKYYENGQVNFNQIIGIQSANQARPVDFNVELRNVKFKEAFVASLIEHWSSDEIAEIFVEKEIYVSFKSCHKYIAENGKIYRTNLSDRSCEGHVEADTKFALFLKFVCEMYATTKNKLRNVKKVNEARSCIFGQSYGMIDDMEAFKKKVVSFDASNLSPCLRELEQQILRTAYVPNIWINAHKNIPSILDPTNYGWSLNNDGEYTFKWFEGPETPETVKEIIMPSENSQVESTKNSIEEFVCEIYATTKNKLRNVKKVNEARSCIFGQSYGMIDDMEAFKKKVVSFDASNLPPCLRELEQQILRTAYVSNI